MSLATPLHKISMKDVMKEYNPKFYFALYLREETLRVNLI